MNFASTTYDVATFDYQTLRKLANPLRVGAHVSVPRSFTDSARPRRGDRGFPAALEICDAANHRAGSRSLIRFGAKPVKADPFVER